MTGREIIPMERQLAIYYDAAFLDRMTEFGKLGYPLSKIINVMNVKDAPSFTLLFDDKNSRVRQSYDAGVDQAEYLVDSKLLQLANGGDLEALKMYEERRSEMKALEEKEKEKRKWEQTTS
jgi:hypothetical protein